MKHGRYIEYYGNGKVAMISNYKNNKLHGEFIMFLYCDDGKRTVKNYLNGIFYGKYLKYNHNKITFGCYYIKKVLFGYMIRTNIK